MQAKYAFISAYLKGAEAKVITQENVTKMLRASSFQDVLAGMANTDIGNYFDQTPAHTFGEVDRHLWRYLGTRISQLENLRFIPDDILKVLRAYVVKYDVINIKSAALQVFTGTKAKLVALGLINKNGLLKELANADNFGQVVDILYKCDLRDYATVLEGWKKEESKPEVVLSAELYSIYYKNFLSLTKGVKDSHVLMKAIGSIIDLTNLEIVSRAIIEDIGMEAADSIIADGYLLPMSNIKEMLSLKLSNLPEKVASAQYKPIIEELLNTYNKTQSILSVGEVIEKYKFYVVRDMLSPRILSPLVVAWYLILKETEIRNLRLIAKAIFDKLPMEEVKDYLVLTS